MQATYAGTPSVDIGATRVPGAVTTFSAMRNGGVVIQQYDYSCGAAAFATLLRYGFNDPVEEDKLLDRVFADATEAEERLIKNKGLSLLDMQKLAQERGYKAQGFRLGADQLAKLQRPVIVFIKPFGYEHFAVLKGIRGDRVHLADPSQGNWRMPLYRFLDMWLDENARGVIFVVERPDAQWPQHSPLFLPAEGAQRPEILSVRQMLEIGRAPSLNQNLRFPP
jgi:hypothetical protein